jgi:hypothetical protein
MNRKRLRFGLAFTAVAATAAFLVSGSVAGPSVGFSSVASANTKAAGADPANVLSAELQEIAWAQGSTPLENGIAGVVKAYGYDDNGPFVPVVAAASGGNLTLAGGDHPEAQKTEPDKNTYLVLKGQKGADSNYDYGTHFLFQGHEAGSPGYITRINLDADGAHRVTLLATTDVNNVNLPTFDGSTWNPWAQRLLFTSEAGPSNGVSQGGVWQSTLDGKVVDLRRYLGRGGFEGIQNDNQGNLYIVEDVGGSTFTGTTARRPNSFVFRFIPNDVSDLTKGGKIQALQVLHNGQPITFADGGTSVNPQAYLDLHTYGNTLATKWVTLTTTNASTATDPDDNALAKSLNATPFKRPENGLFRPGSHFGEFVFDETGDTNATTPAAPTGGFGSLFTLTQSPSSDNGSIKLLYLGNAEHAAFDNVAFWSDTQVGFVEDRGDTLHGQTALDSGWLFDTAANYANASNKPIRFLAQGRDPSATLDSGMGAVYSASFPGKSFFNDGDNEITGIHVSDGDPTKNGILGAKSPKPFHGEGQWRAFYTQQHGDNVTCELIRATSRGEGGDE